MPPSEGHRDTECGQKQADRASGSIGEDPNADGVGTVIDDTGPENETDQNTGTQTGDEGPNADW
eukprot:10231704-Heterocapsa_arctica.AAC.1